MATAKEAAKGAKERVKEKLQAKGSNLMAWFSGLLLLLLAALPLLLLATMGATQGGGLPAKSCIAATPTAVALQGKHPSSTMNVSAWP